ncbi:NTF2-related export protein 2 isoform X2 [Narcine bancroftii]|uniref:NTF2-related export protein 2 isoform X2 n=1 Tax=Narcine bancroftii TaxID=1343680 RepID=UPI003831CC5E
MAGSLDFKTHADQACRAADVFVNIYYETMDKRRRGLTKLYLDTATLVWNGNTISGHQALTEFFEMLPSSDFQVNMLDCQPVHGKFNTADMSCQCCNSCNIFYYICASIGGKDTLPTFWS